MVCSRTFWVAQTVKNLPAMWETRVWSLGGKDPPEKALATHSSILAWKIPWTEEPGRLQSMGSQRVGHDWATSLTFGKASLLAQIIKNPSQWRRHGFDPWLGKISWRRKWQPTPVFLPKEFQGQRNLAGYGPWGSKVGHNWASSLSLFRIRTLSE